MLQFVLALVVLCINNSICDVHPQDYRLRADTSPFGISIEMLQMTGITCSDGSDCCLKDNAIIPCTELAILHLAPWTSRGTSPAYGPAAWLVATTLLQHINKDQALLPGYKVTLDPWNSMHDIEQASLATFDAIATNSGKYVAAFAGDNAASSRYKEFDMLRLPTSFVTDALFPDAHHMLLNPPDMAIAELDALISICKRFDLNGFALVVGSDYPAATLEMLRSSVHHHGLHIYYSYHFVDQDALGLQMDAVVHGIRLSRARIIVWFGTARSDKFLCKVAGLGMQDLLMIGPPYYGPMFAYFPMSECGLDIAKNNTATLLEVGQWLPNYNGNKKSSTLITGVNMTGDEFDRAWGLAFQKYSVEPIPFVGAIQMFADAILHLVLMLKAILIDEQVAVKSLFARDNITLYGLVQRKLFSLQFEGVDGPVMFGGSERGIVKTDRLRRWNTAIFQSYPTANGFWPVGMLLDPYLSKLPSPELVPIVNRSVWDGFSSVQWLSGTPPESTFPDCQSAKRIMNYWEDACTDCHPGTEFVQGSTHLNDFCRSCPSGKFSDGTSSCADCLMGRFAATPGQTSCSECPIGKIAVNAGSSVCQIDIGYYFWAVVSSAFYMLASIAVLIWTEQWLGIPIRDVSPQGSSTLITTSGQHWILRSALPKVKFSETKHPALDSAGSCFHVQVVDKYRLILVDVFETNSVINTSSGNVSLEGGLTVRGFVVSLPVIACLCLALAYGLSQGMAAHPSLLMIQLSLLFGVSAWSLHRHRAFMTPILRRATSFRRQLLDARRPVRCTRGPERAVTVDQLFELYEFFSDFICERDAYYLVGNIVKPVTRDRKLSFAEYTGPSRATWFCSHYWGSPFRHLCQSVRKHSESEGCGGTPAYWICFLSNNQWQVEAELGNDDWRHSSFYLTLWSGVKGTILILDELAMPLTRIWCLFEVVQTFELEQVRGEDSDFHGLLLCTSSGVLNHGATSIEVAMSIAARLSCLRLQDTKSSSRDDHEMIDQLVRSRPGGFDAMNAFVRVKMMSSLLQAKTHFEDDFATLLGNLAGTLNMSEAASVGLSRHLSKLRTQETELMNGQLRRRRFSSSIPSVGRTELQSNECHSHDGNGGSPCQLLRAKSL